MGLDIYLFKEKKKKSVKEKILAELEENEGAVEIAYWRKDWDILGAVGDTANSPSFTWNPFNIFILATDLRQNKSSI